MLDDLILLVFVGVAACMSALGLFTLVWHLRRSEAGEGVQWSRFEGQLGARLGGDREYYGALLARHATGPGERYRRAARGAFLALIAMVVVWIELIGVEALALGL